MFRQVKDHRHCKKCGDGFLQDDKDPSYRGLYPQEICEMCGKNFIRDACVEKMAGVK